MKNASTVLAPDELSVLCYQLSLLVEVGISTEDAVSMLADDTEAGPMRDLLDSLRQKLEDGTPFARALEESGSFPNYMIRMVDIGSASGRLDRVLAALASYYTREASTRESLRRAVAYPAVMAVLIAVIFLVLVSQVLPVFQQVFSQLGVGLSPLASALMKFGSAGQAVTGVLVVVIAVAGIAILLLFRDQKEGSAFGKMFSKTAASKAVDRSRFASAMALMLSSGLPIDEGMERVTSLLEGSALSPAIAGCAKAMDEGTSFPKAAEENGIFTGMQASLLSAGFRSGASDKAMEELSHRCQAEADVLLERQLSRFEYVLVIVLCLAVGLVLLSVMLPLLGVLSAIG